MITMTDCPPRLRGDLSKWLCEIHTGVYVGQVSGRVRDAIWMRVCDNLKTGRATMVYTANNEQGMDFRVYNSAWTPVDFDGIKLMRRPLPAMSVQEDGLKPGFSKAARRQMAQRKRKAPQETWVAIDLETTGLDPSSDRIIEIGAMRVENGAVAGRFSQLVRLDKPLPASVRELTGISDGMLAEEGIPEKEALDLFWQFAGRDPLVGYNLPFDMEFLRAACARYGGTLPANRCIDLLQIARRRVFGLSSYKLAALAEYFSLSASGTHRALADCELLVQVYAKLNEL